MHNNLPLRKEAPIEETWNLKDLFKSEIELSDAIKELREVATTFHDKFMSNINCATTLLNALGHLEEIEKKKTLIRNYVDLASSVDRSDTSLQMRVNKVNSVFAEIESKVSFFYVELTQLPESEIETSFLENPELKPFIKRMYSKKKYMLDPQVEKALANFSAVFNAPEIMHKTTKSADIRFDDFKAGTAIHSLDFNKFENEFEIEPDTEVRRKAFSSFSNKLEEYKHTSAMTYELKLKTEKGYADLRGFKNIFDYLLFDQEVDRHIFDRQIDFVMEYLAPHMRKYAQLIKKVYGLDKITFADLKIPLDPDYEPKISFEETKKYIYNSLGILGSEYLDIIKDAYNKRWIDYTRNIGKSTGAFCYTPYGSHPFILINFTESMRDVFVLAHELGHAGHFHLANRNQNILNSIPSIYFFEAPSTMNEMLLFNYLLKNPKDLRFKRWVISNVLSRTYFHNFVTHLLEAAFQREVYKLVDDGGSITADVLSEIKKGVLEKFWGDDVEINKGAELTWMRQHHYYKGLYPYNYSTGLTIATQVSRKILKDEQSIAKQWLNVLRAGGSKTPIELANGVGIDITSDKPLLDTISYIGELINDIYNLTEQLREI